MKRTEILQIADVIERMVIDKFGEATFDEDFNKVVKVLSNRHVQPELYLGIDKE